MWFWVAAATIVAVVLASIYLLKKPATKPQAPKIVDQPIKTVAPPTIHERTPVTKKEIPHNLSDESPENSTWDDSEMESPVLSEEQMELIRPVTSRDLKLLSLKSQIINLNPGEVLIREGTPIVSGEVFQHLSGVLTVTRGAEKINTIPEYSILGEFCIIRTGNAPYSIIAESPCKVAKISTALLFTLFQDNPSFAKRFYVMVGRKLAEELRRKNSPNSITTSEISESSLFDEEMESSETQTPRHSLLRRSKKDDETKNKEYDIQVAKRFLLPETEIALQRFRVSWKRQSKNRSGTLYVTPNFICFYSKVFGSVKKELQLIVDCTFEIDQKAKLLICKGSYKTLEFSFSKLDRLEKAFQLLGEVKGAATTQEAKGEDSPKTPDNDTHSPILTDKEWKKLLPKNATVYEESDVIVAQGSVEQKVIQLQGDCVVVLKENNQTKIIAELSDGDIVGEMNFMSNLPASASIIANAEVTAYSISKAQLNALWNTNPQIVVKFYHYLCFVIASRLLK